MCHTYLVFLWDILKLILELFQGTAANKMVENTTRAHFRLLSLSSETALHMTIAEDMSTWKSSGWPEVLRTEEVEQVKKFLQVVLKGSACEQQLVLDVVGTQDSEELGTNKPQTVRGDKPHNNRTSDKTLMATQWTEVVTIGNHRIHTCTITICICNVCCLLWTDCSWVCGPRPPPARPSQWTAGQWSPDLPIRTRSEAHGIWLVYPSASRTRGNRSYVAGCTCALQVLTLQQASTYVHVCSKHFSSPLLWQALNCLLCHAPHW